MNNTMFDGFENLELIGSGGYGKIYDSGKGYVIKQLFNRNEKRLNDKR